MKKNLYYTHVFGRTNAIKEFIYNFFLAIASWPRLVLEVFLRKNMGERYFSFSNVVLILLILCWLPFPITKFAGVLQAISPAQINPSQLNINDLMRSQTGAMGQSPLSQSGPSQNSEFFDVITTNLTWYLFLVAVFIASLQRRREVERLPSVFDFARFSLSAGSLYIMEMLTTLFRAKLTTGLADFWVAANAIKACTKIVI